MQLLDGKALSLKIEADVANEVKNLKNKTGLVPGLAVVLVGQDPASAAYVNMKKKACDRVGFYSVTHEMPQDISQDAIENTIKMMNNNPNIDGILIQLPLPSQIDTTKILELVDPSKDVDGFHPYNVGRLSTGLDGFVPCTPLGVMELLKEYNIDPKGKNCVVVGASNIVGKPMAALLLNANATVEICHIFTDDLKKHTLNADMIFVGVGVINLIKEDMVKDGVIIVDIGISRANDGKLVGDVDFEKVSKKCSYITPVPGGVGPMTISMLLSNTLKATKAHANERE
ncbi:MAG: bifunctional methylenetetrahydrofolate dehydrogenase/methenyltetrahydrofolate cyclohydrolase FolD [Sulfurimonas sp.]|jgi:methylenetetrahydrofolate dehydrogenase (NADP+)/methenyltetrahydrofolate cyclohydrolase|uniref:bifunctional methylenetetrahydrofolate dehydrogenase/methenyltetrahydrofolate cyclohydrolase FolD n=1 Tax=unclassified Sulfurimonas TaxID=2623549 RepID=UPI0008D777B0|nr:MULTISPECIES: bifunctional methylenetetrahydrofolate dehydrogenase/methenyltetrahydrofolate cyclohydrolase FolD [unclassified Sulfurimonas]OHE12461.1 MAG: bifunctional methylenetetrahydrofolate dehydrogenase/methenyltetrahydrofolate cyclohydrolase [Sulfurimonas sp. RIFOXYC2_FULL_36_7]MBS4068610.1 bifunctional methylenetetrahydrofolate dehydrogenase/methenyltetrahydrofolate cyclohydrolase FolD [Sulfurimonas sp.]MDD3855338.1 bifunctional methylenetetrahydrofolate dehydrogenase/methenyltetrahydr